MENSTSEYQSRENILLILFGIISVLGICVLSFFPFYLSDQPQEADVLPLCFTPLALGAGSLLMIWMRHILNVSWRSLVIALILWGVGTLIFSFGSFALITPDELDDVRTNAITAVFLCLLPGGGMMLAAAGLYAYSYYKENQDVDDPLS